MRNRNISKRLNKWTKAARLQAKRGPTWQPASYGLTLRRGLDAVVAGFSRPRFRRKAMAALGGALRGWGVVARRWEFVARA